MNLLYICDEYPPGKNGGIGTMVQTLARQLIKSGHKVFVVGLYEYAYGGPDYEVDFGVSVWRKRYGLNLNEGALLLRLLRKMPAFVRQLFVAKQTFNDYTFFIRKLINENAIDIIEVPDWNTFSMNTGLNVMWPKFEIPLVVKLHGSYTYFQTELNQPIDKYKFINDEQLMQRADAIASVSNYTALKTKSIFNINSEIKLLYNAIEVPPKNVRLGVQENTVLFSGNLLVKKGIFQLIKSWNLVIEKIPNAKLFVYGKGNNNVLKKMLTAHANQSVHFEGHVNRELLMEQLSKVSVAVFPSYSETFGLMCIEAMSRGCPVIYTKRSCGPEIIEDGKDGKLIDPDNIEEIANAIIEVLNNKDIREKFTNNGYKSVQERFSINTCETEHINFYNQVIASFQHHKKNS